MTRLSFPLEARVPCDGRGGQYFGQVQVEIASTVLRASELVGLGKKLPEPDNPKELAREIIMRADPRFMHRVVGVDAFRFCNRTVHTDDEFPSRRDTPRFEKVASFFLPKPEGPEPLWEPCRINNASDVSNAQLPIPHTTALAPVVFPPSTPGERKNEFVENLWPLQPVENVFAEDPANAILMRFRRPVYLAERGSGVRLL